MPTNRCASEGGAALASAAAVVSLSGRRQNTWQYERKLSSRDYCRCLARQAVLVGDCDPPLSGLTEVRADFVECLSLGVAARKCGDGGRIAPCVWFRADNRGEIHGDIDDNRRSSGRSMAHGQDPPIVVVYRREGIWWNPERDETRQVSLSFGGGCDKDVTRVLALPGYDPGGFATECFDR